MRHLKLRHVQYGFASAARALHVFALVLSLVLSPIAHALQLKLTSGLNMRQQGQGEDLGRTGYLRAGSVIEIPDAFTVKDSSGKVHVEKTLNNWLRNAGRTGDEDGTEPGLYEFDDGKRDYFFPVRVVTAAPGSTITDPKESGIQFMALRYLARKGKTLAVVEDAATYRAPPNAGAASPAAKAEQNAETAVATNTAAPVSPVAQSTEAAAPCTSGACAERIDQGGAFAALIEKLLPALKNSDKSYVSMNKRTRGDLEHINRNFAQTCGFALSEFMPILRAEAQRNGVPAEILLSIMTIESSGQCFPPANLEHDDTRSFGLFGINSSSSKFPSCTRAQTQAIHALEASQLASGPRCLQNPAINLQEAIRVLKSKRDAVTQPATKIKGVSYRGFDASKMSENDRWRLAVSAYNGGETWVLRAKKDLEDFNARWGTSLQAENWEDLRVFYLRRHLSRSKGAQQHFFGNNRSGRKEIFARLNLAYTENTVPRDPQHRTAGVESLREIWDRSLKVAWK